MDKLDPCGAFLDVGAHIGYYAVMAASFVPEVYAFEPDPRTIPLLRAATRDRASVVEAAVGRMSGTRWFQLNAEPAISHFSDSGIEVPVVTIDEFVLSRVANRVSGIKIDVEGWDFEVLEGAQRVIRRDQPLVLTEFSESPTNDLELLLAFCESCGYCPLAFVRPSVGRGDPRDKHIARLPVDRRWRYKMVFLVPPRQQDVAPFSI
jgi:FkbM family methyltransferase